MDEEEKEQEVTAYELTTTEGDELRLRIAVGGKELVCYMKVNQAFSFLTLFIVTLGQLVSTNFAEGDLRAFFGRRGGPGGTTPMSGGSPLH